MAAEWIIRRAATDDADAISRVVVQAVQQTNARDYSAEIIAEVIQNFSPDRISARMADRDVFVAVEEGIVIGTGSLQDAMVRSVFVCPSQQGRGVGRALMNYIECLAKTKGLLRLQVPASITAESFYRTIGYTAIRDVYYGEERTIIMEKTL